MMQGLTLAAAIILVVCAIVHSILCLMVGRNMCALTNLRVLVRFVNLLIFASAVWLLIFLVPGVVSGMNKSNMSMGYMLTLLYIILSALVHSVSCIIGAPVCGLGDNKVLIIFHNIILLLSAVFVIVFTPLLRLK